MICVFTVSHKPGALLILDLPYFHEDREMSLWVAELFQAFHKDEPVQVDGTICTYHLGRLNELWNLAETTVPHNPTVNCVRSEIQESHKTRY